MTPDDDERENEPIRFITFIEPFASPCSSCCNENGGACCCNCWCRRKRASSLNGHILRCRMIDDFDVTEYPFIHGEYGHFQISEIGSSDNLRR